MYIEENKTSYSALVQLHLQDFILCPDGYTSHAQRYRFFTQPAVRTGLLWKILLNGALGLTTPHFAFCGYRLSLKFPLTGKQHNTGSNPLYSSSSRPPYLSPTCSTTGCHKNYLERPQNIET